MGGDARSLGDLRMLLLQPDGAEAPRIAAALASRGCTPRTVSRIDEALGALAEERFHVAVLAPALLDYDLIACCAALTDVPSAPPLLMLARTGLLAEQSRLLPPGLRPIAVLPEPVDIASLVSAALPLLDHDPDAAAPTRPITPRSDDFALVLGAIARSRQSGILELRCEGTCTRIHLAAGRPVLAEGGALRDTLGRMLVRRGTVSQEDYIRVIDRMTERLVQNESVRMGEVLVELGLLEPSEVFRALSEQMTEKILACFRHLPFEWNFDEGDPPEEAGAGFEIPAVERLTLEGLRRHLPEGTLPPFVETHGDARPSVADARALAVELALGPEERRLLATFDGSRSLRALVAAAGNEGRELAILGAALAATGRLRLGASGERARAPRSRGAEPAPARPRPAPERIRPARRDPARDRLEAERSFHAAQDALRSDRVKEALTAAQRAVVLAPDESEYRMLEAWLAYLAAQVDLRIARAKAVACAERMAQEDPSATRPHVILGRIALDDQRYEDACREFEFALLRSPTDAEAVKGLHQARTGAGQLGGKGARD